MTEPSGLPRVPPADVSSPAGQGAASDLARAGWAPHDVPSAAELLEAVREFLESDVLPAVEGRIRFHVRVAANVVAMVGRELVLGPRQAADHAARLSRLGVTDEAQLAEAIRSGSLDARLDEVRAVVRATVADKLAVANPGYLRPPDRNTSSGTREGPD